MYSKLKALEVTDFMAFPHTRVEFDDRPESGFHSDSIINLKGFNDSGKSALLIAAGVALCNVYPNKHKTFIRTGCSHFRIDASFDDDITIRREKYKNGNSLYEMFRTSTGETLFTTAAGNFLTAAGDVPTVISDYLGTFSYNNFSLNIRRRTDPMLLVNTKGSENYDIVNNVLKTQELSNASRVANKTANQLQNDIQDIDNEIRANEISLSDIWVDEAVVEKIKTLESAHGILESVHNTLKSFSGIVESLEPLLDNSLTPEEFAVVVRMGSALEDLFQTFELQSQILSVGPEVSADIGETLPEMESSGLFEDMSVMGSIIGVEIPEDLGSPLPVSDMSAHLETLSLLDSIDSLDIPRDPGEPLPSVYPDMLEIVVSSTNILDQFSSLPEITPDITPVSGMDVVGIAESIIQTHSKVLVESKALAEIGEEIREINADMSSKSLVEIYCPYCENSFVH